MIIAETSRLILRQFRLDDLEAMNAVYRDAEVMRYGDGVQSPARVRAWIGDWIEKYYLQWGFGMWAVMEKKTAVVIGYCGLSQFPGRCAEGETEIGFRLARRHWGCGFATESAMAVRDHAFAELRLPCLIALIAPANVASIRVAEKIGMRYEREAMLAGYDHPDEVYSVNRVTGG